MLVQLLEHTSSRSLICSPAIFLSLLTRQNLGANLVLVAFRFHVACGTSSFHSSYHFVQLVQEFFTDELAQQYSSLDLLFISDIRTADPAALQVTLIFLHNRGKLIHSFLQDEEVEEGVIADQMMQMKWHLILNPQRSMLKFRPPWGAGTFTYLAGEIFLPVWGRQSTTETRLICSGDEVMEVDNVQYGDQLFHFNTVTRVSYYHHEVSGVLGLCHCYDCAAEVQILAIYLIHKRTNAPVTTLDEKLLTSEMSMEIARMSLNLNTACSPTSRRSLEVDISHASRSWFAPRKYLIDKKEIVEVEGIDFQAARNETRKPRSFNCKEVLASMKK